MLYDRLTCCEALKLVDCQFAISFLANRLFATKYMFSSQLHLLLERTKNEVKRKDKRPKAGIQNACQLFEPSYGCCEYSSQREFAQSQVRFGA
jgi:hypothetical protein